MPLANDGYGISEDTFGVAIDPITQKECSIRRFTFANNHKMVVQVITYGAAITKITVPDSKGCIRDVVLGFDDIKDYEQPKLNPYFGAAVGRVANRIANGQFMLNGKKIQVTRNWKDKHTLHGGVIGFNKVIWDVDSLVPEKCELRLKHTSSDGHEGFPGTVTATVDFKLTETNEFHMKFKATTDKPTPINLTNHSYFNLNGHGAGRTKILKHHIQIHANEILVTDDDSIPTGALMNVTQTPFDFRILTELGPKIVLRENKGFDDNYCLLPSPDDSNPIRVVAVAVDAERDIKLTIDSDQKGLQFYTGNSLPNLNNKEPAILGKADAAYSRQGAFCFETQGYPDAVNHPNFPSVIVNPGQTYEHNLIYKFSTS